MLEKRIAMSALVMSILGAGQWAAAATVINVEAENYTARTTVDNRSWFVIDGSVSGGVAGNGEASVNGGIPATKLVASTGAGANGNGLYMQLLRDTGGFFGGANSGPTLDYTINLPVAGVWTLTKVRAGGPNNNGNTLYVQVVGVADGTGGSINDWYRITGNQSGGFNDVAAGGPEAVNFSGGDVAMSWSLPAGNHTFRFTPRADGVAIDNFTLTGPAIPEPASMALLVLSGGLLMMGRRR